MYLLHPATHRSCGWISTTAIASDDFHQRCRSQPKSPQRHCSPAASLLGLSSVVIAQPAIRKQRTPWQPLTSPKHLCKIASLAVQIQRAFEAERTPKSSSSITFVAPPGAAVTGVP
ncbi:hypothetical protein LR48_Vigan11g094700 [Vigna angularis]|uniref:Uncharacterized protein n=1 Tax=Phaseolus angularis TaxID=3914 RepID=A0A0L9VT27_PHAAN|nr:hypothetical protein LR48_Vigan11g094700 [Vigna angularis]